MGKSFAPQVLPASDDHATIEVGVAVTHVGPHAQEHGCRRKRRRVGSWTTLRRPSSRYRGAPERRSRTRSSRRSYRRSRCRTDRWWYRADRRRPRSRVPPPPVHTKEPDMHWLVPGVHAPGEPGTRSQLWPWPSGLSSTTPLQLSSLPFARLGGRMHGALAHDRACLADGDAELARAHLRGAAGEADLRQVQRAASVGILIHAAVAVVVLAVADLVGRPDLLHALGHSGHTHGLGQADVIGVVRPGTARPEAG